MDMLEVMKERVYTVGIFTRYVLTLMFHSLCLVYLINVMGVQSLSLQQCKFLLMYGTFHNMHQNSTVIA